MPGLFDRIKGFAGSDIERAADLAHRTFQGGVDQHGHHGRALIETLAKLCRDHPNLVGIGVGLLVEQLLSEEKREFDRKHLNDADLPTPVVQPEPVRPPTASSNGIDPFMLAPLAAVPATIAIADAAPRPHDAIVPPVTSRPVRHLHAPHAPDLHKIKPMRLALEVFGGLILVKFGHAMGKLFRRNHPHHDGWFAQAARIHALSAAIATYCFCQTLRAPKVSAIRNGMIGFFGTHAIKPLLKPVRRLKAA